MTAEYLRRGKRFTGCVGGSSRGVTFPSGTGRDCPCRPVRREVRLEETTGATHDYLRVKVRPFRPIRNGRRMGEEVESECREGCVWRKVTGPVRVGW